MVHRHLTITLEKGIDPKLLMMAFICTSITLKLVQTIAIDENDALKPRDHV